MAGQVAEFEVLGPWSLETSRRFWEGFTPFAAELVVVRGANAPDALPHHERRLDAEIAERYGPGRTLAEVSETWRPYRTWAAVHLRALREQRTGKIADR
jgi:DNA-3-methyladenine glycosylase II